MKKWIVTALVVLILGGGLYLYLDNSRLCTIETSFEDNTITMKGKRSGDGTGGTGIITVGEGEHLHLEYELTKGSFDLSVSSNAAEGTQEDLMEVSVAELTSKDPAEAMFGGLSFQQKGIEGSGSLDIEEEPGEYTVLFQMYDVTGQAVLSAKPE